jgi:acetyltransferase-like isoleucine patch superfamily enzyme
MRSTLRNLLDSAVRLRSWLRTRRVPHAGRDIHVEPSSLLSYPSRMRMGDGVRIGPHVAVRANSARAEAIRLDAGCLLQDGAVLNASEGRIEIGERTWIGPYVVIYGNGTVTIGRDVMVAAHSCITSVGHGHADLSRPMMAQPITVAPVTIEDDVWIGMNCTILPGVRIGRGAIVAAGALVRRDVAPYEIVGGVPARTIGRRDAAIPGPY